MKQWEEAPITDVLGIKIYSFGLYCAIGVLCAVAAIYVLCRAANMKKGTSSILSLISIAFGIIFSRLLFCLSAIIISGGIPFSAWFRISSGGWSFFGMIIGVMLAAKLSSVLLKEDKNKLLDHVCCALPLVMAAERFAERLFDGFNVSRELQGNGFPRNTFLAVQDVYYPDVSFMATYLCAAICSILLFLILVVYLTRPYREDGDIWILFMILVGAGGIMLESLRYDSHLEYSFVRFQQVIAAVMMVIGVVTASLRNRGAHKGFMRTAFISLPLAVGACGGIEYALDRTTINHYLLYAVMFVVLAIPVTFGILLLIKREKGAERS